VKLYLHSPSMPSGHGAQLKKSTGATFTTVLPVALYGCETLSLMLREEHRLRVFDNRVLRRIF